MALGIKFRFTCQHFTTFLEASKDKTMPQIKKARKLFSIEKALIFHPDITKFASKNLGVFMGKEEYMILAKVACLPMEWRGLRFPPDLLERFGKMYSKNPDEVIAFLGTARSVLLKWQKTQAGKVLKFLCRENFTVVEQRSAVRNSEGERIAVIVENLLNGKKKRIPLNGLSEGEMNGAMFPMYAAIDSLSDKELGILWGASADSVKKARQEAANIAHEIEYWDHPAVVAFMKTGQMSPQLIEAQKAYFKGKK